MLVEIVVYIAAVVVVRAVGGEVAVLVLLLFVKPADEYRQFAALR